MQLTFMPFIDSHKIVRSNLYVMLGGNTLISMTCRDDCLHTVQIWTVLERIRYGDSALICKVVVNMCAHDSASCERIRLINAARHLGRSI